jgi:hypothetical protein
MPLGQCTCFKIFFRPELSIKFGIFEKPYQPILRKNTGLRRHFLYFLAKKYKIRETKAKKMYLVLLSQDSAPYLKMHERIGF